MRGSLGRNGSVLTVVNADKGGIELRNADGKQGYVPWDRLTQGGKVRLAYGEVMTTHTAQGSTATEHVYAMPQGTKAVNGFSSYSSGTRHEQKSYMVISAGAERAEVAARRPIGDPRPMEERSVGQCRAQSGIPAGQGDGNRLPEECRRCPAVLQQSHSEGIATGRTEGTPWS